MDQKKFLEIVERSNTGVRVTSDDWNLKYVAKLCRKVSKAHGMKWDKEVIIPQDDELPDTMFWKLTLVVLPESLPWWHFSPLYSYNMNAILKNNILIQNIC